MHLHELIERLQEAAQRLGTSNPTVAVEMIDTLPGHEKPAPVVEVEHSNGKPIIGGFSAPCIVIRG